MQEEFRFLKNLLEVKVTGLGQEEHFTTQICSQRPLFIIYLLMFLLLRLLLLGDDDVATVVTVS